MQLIACDRCKTEIVTDLAAIKCGETIPPRLIIAPRVNEFCQKEYDLCNECYDLLQEWLINKLTMSKWEYDYAKQELWLWLRKKPPGESSHLSAWILFEAIHLYFKEDDCEKVEDEIIREYFNDLMTVYFDWRKSDFIGSSFFESIQEFTEGYIAGENIFK